MGHAYNFGIVTSAKGITYEAIRLRWINAQTAWTVDEDCGAGLIASVTTQATGDFLLNLAKPYPAKIVYFSPEMAAATNTAAAIVARGKNASYSLTNGTYEFFTSNSAGTGAVNPNDQDECHIVLGFRRYTANP